MPELPEVETIRMGLAKHILGKTIADVRVWGHRTARAQEGGAKALEDLARGREIRALVRRGKFLWAELDSQRALVFHLGMSGQLRIEQSRLDFATPPQRHEQARLLFDNGSTLSFFDQRTFGRMEVIDVVATCDGQAAGHGSSQAFLPLSVTHIARDPLDPAFEPSEVVRKIRSSRARIKNLLLHQEIVSGIGNIYADEALFAAGIHGGRMGKNVRKYEAESVIKCAAKVMVEAIKVGGTSFDALYVDTEGSPGYFARSLAVYGRQGQPCIRCGTLIQRVVIQGRSHHFCPQCQPRSGR